MHILALTSFLIATARLCQAQTDSAPDNAADHWCGKWAGSPNPSNAPSEQQFPARDFTRRFFVEPQLQRTPFAPIVATEPKVQIPKIWGNNEFRVALLSYTDKMRIYASSKSRWTDFGEAFNLLMSNCVSKGSGGAYLVPPSPGLTQATLVIYAYAVGSYFDFQMNYYMSQPYGINPATLQQTFAANNGSFTTRPAVDVL